MPRPDKTVWVITAAILGLLYPLCVYYGLSRIPPIVFVFFALVLFSSRIPVMKSVLGDRAWIIFGVATLTLLGILFLSPPIAVKVYPVIITAASAAIFGYSLFNPPPLIERIARLREPNLPLEGVAYTRKVTIVWTVFLVCNAAIAAITGLWGTTAQWALWNGLLSYLCIGTLFIGERLLRKRLRG